MNGSQCKQAARLFGVAMLAGSASCIGFSVVNGPPKGHEVMTSFSCTTSHFLPYVEVIVALNIIPTSFAVASGVPALIAAGAVSGLFIASTVVGFRKTANCRMARTALITRTPPEVIAPQLPAAAIAVTPLEDTLAVGGALQLRVEVRASSGALIPGATVVWSSSNAGLASVSASGLVTARAAGVAFITATADHVSATVTIVVRR